MSRNPQIEAIHEARYNLQTAAHCERGERRRKLNALLETAIAQSNLKVTPQQLLDALFDDYKEFRRTKKRSEWPHLS
jgi:hypothetical protein